ncbi:putative secondary metabolism biosynthetic enzyme [Paecilomyces lecythidis]
MDIDGVVLVFGAGSGIGRQTADSIDSSYAEQSSNKRATGMQIDVRKEDEVENLVHGVKSQYGRIDVCVNTAGVGALRQTPISSMTLDEYRDMDEVHNIGSFLIMRAVLKVIRGSIVILTSLASEGAFLGVGNYIAAKHAVKGLVQTAAIENARKGIRINAVAPSYVSGPMINKFFDEAPEAKKAMLGDLAMDRLAEPEEVADAVVFLASSAASYINGHTLVVDGGTSLQLANQPFSG